MMEEMFFLEENSFPDDLSFLNYATPGPLERMDEDARKEYWASLALRYCAGAGSRAQTKLLNRYGSAFIALQNVDEWAKLGLPAKLKEEISSGRWRRRAAEEWHQAKETNSSILLWNNAAFPHKLRELPDCPLFLYFVGDIKLLNNACVSMVGSRNATSRNCEVALSLAKFLSSCGITIISGMAFGIDCHAHLGALRRIGKSIGVLGTGINVDYPRANRQLFDTMRAEGLLISELAPNTPPVSRNFPVRNRIISGLSLGVVVVEAAEKSGSLITARLALEQNREVFAVPGGALDATSAGCQNLLRQGAHVVFSGEDILRDLAGELHSFGLEMSVEKTMPMIGHDAGPVKNIITSPAPETTPPPMDEDGRAVADKMATGEIPERILSILRKKGRMHVDELAQALDITQNDLNSSLVVMEMLGQISRLPGSYFEAIP